jgi:prepilin-type processing-associated H-X9-DG protein
MVREASARATCQNNLHQIALANMNYESSNGTFLPGLGKNGCCWGTWMIPVLAYMEQDNLGKLYVNFGGLDYTGPRYTGGANATVASTRLKNFTCPSDIPQAWGRWTKHNYVLNAGNTTFYQVNLPIGCTSGSPGCTTYGGAPFNWYNDPASLAVGWDSTYPWDQPTPPYPNIDAGKMGRPVRIGEITDGTSNTMMASEALQGRQSDLRGFTWWGGGAAFTAYLAPNSSEPDVVTGGICTPTISPLMPCVEPSTQSRPRLMAARSLHDNGVNAAMCDGSVRFVPNTIDINVWRALSTARGQETNLSY